MAARNPTDFTRWIDQKILAPGKPILAATIDSVVDDQEYFLDAEQLIMSDCFYRRVLTVAGWTEIRRWALDTKDMCDEAAIVAAGDQIEHEVTFLAWCSDGSTAAEVRLSSTTAADSYTATVAAGTTTPAWTAYGSLDIETNGTEEVLILDAQRTAGSGSVYISGIGLFAIET